MKQNLLPYNGVIYSHKKSLLHGQEDRRKGWCNIKKDAPINIEASLSGFLLFQWAGNSDLDGHSLTPV